MKIMYKVDSIQPTNTKKIQKDAKKFNRRERCIIIEITYLQISKSMIKDIDFSHDDLVYILLHRLISRKA